MQKITQIDLLVHPFFNYCPEWLVPRLSDILYLQHYEEKESGTMMRVWKKSVDELQEDNTRRMIFVSKVIRQRFFDGMKRDRINEKEDYEWYIRADPLFTEAEIKEKFKKEAELLKYGFQCLGNRLLFIQVSFTGREDKVEQFISGAAIDSDNFRLNIYGELLTSCVMDEAARLAKCLPIRLRKEHIRLKPKRSVDAVYLGQSKIPSYRIWELAKIEKLRKEGTIQKELRDSLIRLGMERYRKERRKFFEKLFGDA